MSNTDDELERQRRRDAENSQHQQRPADKARPQSGQRRLPPVRNKIAFGDSNLYNFKPGQNVVCRVVSSEAGGYAVVLQKTNAPGFLPTKQIHQVGDELLVQFVTVHNNRVMLATIVSNHVSQSQSVERIRWEDHLNQIDGEVTEMPQPMPQQVPPPPMPPAGLSQSQSQPIQLPQAPYNPNVPPTAQTFALPEVIPPPFGPEPFAPAPQDFSPPQPPQPSRKFRLRRATDLIMPPLDESGLSTFKIADYDLEWLITDLEGGMRTGCVKASSEERLSRSAMLLFKGRAVGCIYGCKSMPDAQAQAVETQLKYMFRDLALPSTMVKVFDLPENITLAMSALFLGNPLPRTDQLDAASYVVSMATQIDQDKSTACLAITFDSGDSLLVYFFEGAFCGAFYVEEQSFIQDRNYVLELLRAEPQANVVASLLPKELITAVRFGHSLSMANQSRGY